MRKGCSIIKLIILTVSLAVLGSCPAKNPEKPPVSGSFEGQAEGFLGKVSVKIIIEKNKIKHIDILEYSDTPGYSNVVFDYLPKKIITKKIDEVDTISGATITSKALLEAVKDALKNANLN